MASNTSILKKIKTELSKTEKNLNALREKRDELTKELDTQIAAAQEMKKNLNTLKKQTEADLAKEKEKENRLASLLGKAVEKKEEEPAEEENDEIPEAEEAEDISEESDSDETETDESEEIESEPEQEETTAEPEAPQKFNNFWSRNY